MSSRKSSAPWFWIVFFLLLFVVIAAVVFLPRWYVEIQLSGLPPDVYELVKRFRTEPVEIPESYLTPPEVPDDLLELVETHRSILEVPPPPIPKNLESKTMEGAEFSEAEWEEVASLLSAVEPQIGAILGLTSNPAHWIGIFPKTLDSKGNLDYGPVQAWGRYLRLKALSQIEETDLEGAIKTLIALVRLSIRHPSDAEIEQLIALALTWRAIEPIATFSRVCGDVHVLERLLDQLNEMAPTIQVDTFEDPALFVVADIVRLERRNGGSLEVFPGRTALDYLRESSAPSSATSRKQRSVPNPKGPTWFQNVIHVWWVLAGAHEFAIAPSFSYLLESRLREMHISSGFDLARLALANRIHELETGAKATDQNAFIPNLLEEPLLDPFTEKPYLWDASAEAFYGVAPDGVDDGNRFSYAPTNGTTSSGDFSLR